MAFINNVRIANLTSDNIDVEDLLAQDATITGELRVGLHILIDGPNGRIIVDDDDE